MLYKVIKNVYRTMKPKPKTNQLTMENTKLDSSKDQTDWIHQNENRFGVTFLTMIH